MWHFVPQINRHQQSNPTTRGLRSGPNMWCFLYSCTNTPCRCHSTHRSCKHKGNSPMDEQGSGLMNIEFKFIFEISNLSYPGIHFLTADLKPRASTTLVCMCMMLFWWTPNGLEATFDLRFELSGLNSRGSVLNSSCVVCWSCKC